MNLKGYTYALMGAKQELEETRKRLEDEEDELHRINRLHLDDLAKELRALRQELRESGECPHEHVYEDVIEDYHNNTTDVDYECALCGQCFDEFHQPEGSTIVVRPKK